MAIALNTALGFLGQFALFYPYYVARDWAAGLGIGSPGIPFRDGYGGALLIGIPLVAAWAALSALANGVVLRRASVSRRPYWIFAMAVALLSAIVQLRWNTAGF